MGIKRIVDVSFWTDGKVDDFSPEDKYFMLYLLTNPFSKQLGIYEISIKQASFQMGYSMDAFNVLLERFEKKYKIIRFSKETNEIAILNFLRHSVMKGGKPVEDCIKKDMAMVKNKTLIDYVFSHLYGKDGLNATVKNIVNEYINENGIQYDNDNGNDNDNDNDNDRSCHESCDESSTEEKPQPEPKPEPKPKSKPKPPKHRHGEYAHVLLTDEEEEKLIDEFGIEFALRAIKFLDEYIEETGYSRKSHYLCIKRWVMDAAKEKEAKDIQSGKVPKARYGDFDAQAALDRALERTFGEEPKTTANDEAIRARAEALKKQLSK